ncbi:discoidin domain-containing protein [Paraglaciecola sp. L3A3]|uniref:DUF7133 domain-containing protein n=1 Tax=Paraglaciecola sp. L3A3 TaxID=2686358 RepID=UPI00131DCE36|nr:discoidin domain-containing protein [Paraglaciecola sp. L3A3]
MSLIKKGMFVYASLMLLSSINVLANDDYDPALHKEVEPLSPEQSLKTMVLQDGYEMQIVAAEPLIEEPVLFTFDGNGRIYIAEMLTYMQDAEGTGKFNKSSRIKRLEDKDGDGLFETYTIFADGLLLPRMITTLDDGRILVRETNTLDIIELADTDGDGVSDTRKTVYLGGERGGNLEHQPSGLMYNIDNWMYVTYTDKRYKYVDGKVQAQSIAYGSGQWGLAQDNVGRTFYSTAGGQNPAFTFQAPSVYSQVYVEGEQAEGFREVFPLDHTPDVQGGLPLLREDNTLNHFTGGGGQSIYLADKFADMYGDYIIPEPVGNLVRRAKVTREDGYTVLSHPYQNKRSEFIASTDANFRPVWSGMAPDGSIFLLDMYRGIIQEGNWTQKGSYLRGVIDKYGFDKIIGRGRLYRITKPGIELTDSPQMFNETPAELVKHLTNKNHWWRLEAQKLLVLKSDLSVVPALKQLALDARYPQAQIHALWTLEGLGILDKSLLLKLIDSGSTDVRITALRISEQLIISDNKDISQLWLKLASDKDIEVAQQVVLSAYYVMSENHLAILQAAKQTHPNKKGLIAIENSMINLIAMNEKRRKLAAGNADLAKAMIAGEKAFKGLCSTCHGVDGKGGGSKNTPIAPSFYSNPRVVGNTAQLINLVIGGMQGPIEGQTFAGGMMPSIASNGDQYVADVLTYIRNEFGNQASIISKDDVTLAKQTFKDRSSLWSHEQLTSLFANPLPEKNAWKVTTNFKVKAKNGVKNLIDGKYSWPKFSGAEQRDKGHAITIELHRPAFVSQVIVDSKGMNDNYSRNIKIEFSMDGQTWTSIINNPAASDVEISETLGLKTQFVRITNQIESAGQNWGISELDLIGSYL